MPQVFPRRANVWAKVSLIVALLALPVLFLILWQAQRTGYMVRAKTPITQPIPFSHQVHVGFGLNCQYCHSTAGTSAFAGIPSTKTCMTCHSQIMADSPLLTLVRESFNTDTPIRWLRVYSVPDFVYFDHSIHVSKGIGCETCHGRVDQMPVVSQQAPLTMEWCVACHREPEQYVRPRESIFKMGYEPSQDQLTLGRQLVKKYHIRPLLNCVTCHR